MLKIAPAGAICRLYVIKKPRCDAGTFHLHSLNKTSGKAAAAQFAILVCN
jgi:hypothetical protein